MVTYTHSRSKTPPEKGKGSFFVVLSSKEAHVLHLIALGLSVSDIAEQDGRSVKTISAQKRSAMRKLKLRTDMELYEYIRHVGASTTKW